MRCRHRECNHHPSNYHHNVFYIYLSISSRSRRTGSRCVGRRFGARRRGGMRTRLFHPREYLRSHTPEPVNNSTSNRTCEKPPQEAHNTVAQMIPKRLRTRRGWRHPSSSPSPAQRPTRRTRRARRAHPRSCERTSSCHERCARFHAHLRVVAQRSHRTPRKQRPRSRRRCVPSPRA